MNWFKKCVGNFKKIVDKTEESNRDVLLNQCFIVAMFLYFLVILAVTLVSFRAELFMLSMAEIVCCGICYVLMDKGKKRAEFILFQAMQTIWIVCNVVLLGWDCGVQFFIFVQMVEVLVLVNFSFRNKIIFCLGVCGFRICLLIYELCVPPLISGGKGDFIVYQAINSIGTLALLGISVILYGENLQAMEEKQRDYNQELNKLAAEDPLTRLMNRRSARGFIDEVLEKENVSENHLCIAIADIDFFKKINDEYGHECGDFILCSVSDIFRNYMKEKGIVGRWGGEEFLFVFNNTEGEDAYYYLAQLQNVIRNKVFCYETERIRITMTYGLIECVEGMSVDECIDEADKKLYLGKRSGRNTIIF